MSVEDNQPGRRPGAPAPLSGYRILDFTERLQGPLGTQILGDLGAEVIKVERLAVLTPDGRPVPRYRTAQRDDGRYDLDFYSAAFLALNRNKKSIAVDLKTEVGQQVARRLVTVCDVVYENFRPGVMDRLGLGYTACAELNPAIVYASASGYGPDGPYADRPGQDILAQAISGLGALNALPGGRPWAVGIPIADILGGMNGALAVLAALLHRDRTGQGQHVQVNLLSSVVAAQAEEALLFLNAPVSEPERETEMHAHAYIPPPYGFYATKDGYLALSSGQDLPGLSRALGIEDLSRDSRFATSEARDRHRAVFERLLEEVLTQRTTEEWLRRMAPEDIYAAPVHGLAAAFSDPQISHNQMVVTVDSPIGPLRMVAPPFRFSSTPARVRSAPPLHGEHSEEMLRLAGFTEDEVGRIMASGAVLGTGPVTRQDAGDSQRCP
jgi:succinate--hydroxymethylglutarate CoA-transferase